SLRRRAQRASGPLPDEPALGLPARDEESDDPDRSPDETAGVGPRPVFQGGECGDSPNRREVGDPRAKIGPRLLWAEAVELVTLLAVEAHSNSVIAPSRPPPHAPPRPLAR